jgi:hypothetical protein
MIFAQFYQICDCIEPDKYGCLHYPGATRGFHHSVWVEGRRRKPHRLALERKLGRPIRPGFGALHTCDYPPCVNMDHLYEGTQKDNVRDMLLRNPDVAERLKQFPKIGAEAFKKKYRGDAEFRAKMKEAWEPAREKHRKDPEFRAKLLANLEKAWEARRKPPDEVSP